MKILPRNQGLHELRKFGNLCLRELPHGHMSSPKFPLNLYISHYDSGRVYIRHSVLIDSIHSFIHSMVVTEH